MEGNIDLEPQLEVMMCPDMAVWGRKLTEQMLFRGRSEAAKARPPSTVTYKQTNR